MHIIFPFCTNLLLLGYFEIESIKCGAVGGNVYKLPLVRINNRGRTTDMFQGISNAECWFGMLTADSTCIHYVKCTVVVIIIGTYIF